jgi:2-keto-4-pentenoate hydratase/2-oxohepta-3-ene-1,7-dioic acid hydratase in catechol pathway
MRLANIDNRAALVIEQDGAEKSLDLARASDGRWGPDLGDVFRNWSDVVAWASEVDVPAEQLVPVDRARLGAPSPAPRQVFALGLNYRAHAAESGFAAPTELPPVFTKYVSSFSGPDTEVVLPPGSNVDWEIELVAIVGREARDVAEDDAWSYVAGLTAGQDLSERLTQMRGPAPQFGLGKSYPGFSPQGPWLVTPDEFANPDDLELGCAIDGVEVQKGQTSDLIFGIARMIAALSENVTLYPGDVIFTGTPSGVGMGREPQRYLRAGERLDSWIAGIGELHQTFVSAPAAR